MLTTCNTKLCQRQVCCCGCYRLMYASWVVAYFVVNWGTCCWPISSFLPRCTSSNGFGVTFLCPVHLLFTVLQPRVDIILQAIKGACYMFTTPWQTSWTWTESLGNLTCTQFTKGNATAQIRHWTNLDLLTCCTLSSVTVSWYERSHNSSGEHWHWLLKCQFKPIKTWPDYTSYTRSFWPGYCRKLH